MLIEYDIDPHVMNHEFQTPISIAEENRQYDVMNLLGKYAIDLECNSYRLRDSGSDSGFTNDSDSESSHPSTVREESVTPDDIPMLYQATSRLLGIPESIHSTDSSDSHHSTPPKKKPTIPFSIDSRSPSPRPKSAHTDDSGYFSEEQYSKLSMEQKMDEMPDAKHTLAKVNLKKKNPFSKVRVTKGDGKTVRALLREMEQLPELNGFLLKQTSKPPYSYHKRWVYVTEKWILWNDRVVSTNFVDEQAPTLEERKRFKSAVNLNNIVVVQRTGKSGKKLMFKVRIKTHDKLKYRKVIFKCHSTRDRDYWCDGLTKYVHYCKEMKRLYGM